MAAVLKWNLFAAAAAVVWFVLLWLGAPIAPLALGTVIAGFWNYRQRRRA